MRVALRATAASVLLIVLTAAPAAQAARSADTSGEDQYGYVFPSSGGPKTLGNKPTHGSGSSASPSSGAPATTPGTAGGGSGGGNPARSASRTSPSSGAAGALGSVLSRLPGTPGAAAIRSGHGARLGHGQTSPFATSGQGQSGTSFSPGRSFLSAFGNAAKTTGAAGILIVLLLVSLVTAGATALAIRGRRVSRRRI